MRGLLLSAVGGLLLCSNIANATALLDMNPSISASFKSATVGGETTQVIPQGVQITFGSSTYQDLKPVGNASASGSVGITQDSPLGHFSVGIVASLDLIANFQYGTATGNVTGFILVNIFNGTGQTLDNITFTGIYHTIQFPGIGGSVNSETAEQVRIDSFLSFNPVNSSPEGPLEFTFKCLASGSKKECSLPSAESGEVEFGFGPIAPGDSRYFELHLDLDGFAYAVPEPASGLLLLGGLGALGLLRRTRLCTTLARKHWRVACAA